MYEAIVVAILAVFLFFFGSPPDFVKMQQVSALTLAVTYALASLVYLGKAYYDFGKWPGIVKFAKFDPVEVFVRLLLFTAWRGSLILAPVLVLNGEVWQGTTIFVLGILIDRMYATYNPKNIDKDTHQPYPPWDPRTYTA